MIFITIQVRINDMQMERASTTEQRQQPASENGAVFSNFPPMRLFEIESQVCLFNLWCWLGSFIVVFAEI